MSRATRKFSRSPLEDDAPVNCQFYSENIEGLKDWNINPRFWEDRKPGLSAMLRVKNEGQFLLFAVASIIDWHDEVCILVQGKQDDNTLEVANQCCERWPAKVSVHEYPFESVVNGPDHDLQQRGSVYERAYFYNWCLAKTNYTFANKWDGDMIAFEWLGPRVRSLMNNFDGIWFKGMDLASPKLDRVSLQAHTATEQRVHRVTEKTFYFTYTHCEHFSGTRSPDHKVENIYKITMDYAFLHLKWCKSSLAFSGVGWPDDWETRHPYYTEIQNRKRGIRAYRGPWPAAIKPYLKSLEAAQ